MSFPPNMTMNPYQQAAAFQPNPFSPVPVVALAFRPGDGKPKKRTCSVAGCKNGIVQGGVCVSHGAKRRQCGFPGCTKSSKCVGMCSKHGPARKPCSVEGCTTLSIKGGKCKNHAPPTLFCCVGECRKVVAVNGMCKMHNDEVEAGAVPMQAGMQFVQVVQAPPGFMVAQPNYGFPGAMCQMIAPPNNFLMPGSQPAVAAPAAGPVPGTASAFHNPMPRIQKQSPNAISFKERVGSYAAAQRMGQGFRNPSDEAMMLLHLSNQARANRANGQVHGSFFGSFSGP